MKNRKWFTAVGIALLCLNLPGQAEPAFHPFDTKTKIRLEKRGIWVESEISPQALLVALPEIDQNGDGRLDEFELSRGHDLILAYYASHVALKTGTRTLRTDSTYFAFRSPVSPNAVPDRFFIYHWYAMLRPPSEVQITNHLFEDVAEACVHQGSLINQETVLSFTFPPAGGETHAAANGVRFKFDSDGKASLLDSDTSVARAGYVWVGVGVGGLLLLRLASVARARWSRSEKLDGQEEDEEEMEESPAFS
ncbi:MAG: hypothetical protein ONB48_17270 [candidate division KSB1 bacterium]|nr:hypothetical protein [candidate division KSB1 bacterium]MDZ7275230.1 hypothetical protein [candidate division KSB1 bacterium]MDZ7287398.1 hypothetical protein [candidate division KSB1 bacterium]MDZ7299512.1 hypothetical protein [candidate division KSB1 bacterium]MDZ7305443.1 hypothetical protein [candidate division KSB1 bacterium]